MKTLNIKSIYFLLIVFIIIGNPLNSVYSQNIENKIDSLLVNVFKDKNGPGGEFLVSKAGLGYLIVYGGQVFKLDLVMTSVIILGIVAGIMYLAVLLLEKFIVKSRNA